MPTLGHRAAASALRRLSDDFERWGHAPPDGRDVLDYIDAAERAGEIALGAARAGWLHDIPGIDALVKWYDALPGKSTLVRTPVNFFVELVGGNKLPVKSVGKGEVEVTGEPMTGGLLSQYPELAPARCSGERVKRGASTSANTADGHRRNALACTLLAEIIDAHADAANVRWTTAEKASKKYCVESKTLQRKARFGIVASRRDGKNALYIDEAAVARLYEVREKPRA